mgnify:CR=1 FL=1
MLLKCNAAQLRKSFTCRPIEHHSKSPGNASLQYHPQFEYFCRKFLKLEFKKLLPCLDPRSIYGGNSQHSDIAARVVRIKLFSVIVNFRQKHTIISPVFGTPTFTQAEVWLPITSHRARDRKRQKAFGLAYQFAFSRLISSSFPVSQVTDFYVRPKAGVS